jgi:hypothetical protein
MYETGDSVWYRRPAALFARPMEFFPAASQSPEERVNALVRLIAYVAVGVGLWRGDARAALAAVAAIAALSAVHAFGGEAFSGPPRPGLAESNRARGGKCVKSTAENPFANVLLTDLADDPDRPPACDYDDMRDDIEVNFNRGLFRNVTDVYDRENSQRQFMTNPVTTGIPDTLAFAQFAYGNQGDSCKESPAACTGFDG